MRLDKIEHVSLGTNPTWGAWLDDSTFQTYPNACPEKMIQFFTLKKFTLKLGKNSRLNFLDKSYELNCYLGENAVLLHQGLPKSVGNFDLQQNAQLIHRNIYESGMSCSSITVGLSQPNAKVDWRDGVSLEQNESFDLNIKVDHVAPKTHSNCLLKSIVKDSGRLKFFCDIFVQQQATDCTAHQRNLNHILSPYGQITAQPNLHIFNRNIEASHGTATQPIPKDVLFYLQSRGLTGLEAEQTYFESFFNEIYANK